MARVKLLDEQLANQIAAGEVVERPSSVVKELVENSIDAGSTQIDVTIEEGGLTFIRVKDNGDGIDPSDMETAFMRHATSKISSSLDLFRIASLGFRGEALPSIAAVSKVECISSHNESGLGQRIYIEGGQIVANEEAAASKGTDMLVKDLFYNTPARLKYMKTIQTELGHISDYMNRIALAHPGISITLKHNGNVLLRTLGTGDRQQVIAAIYGSSTAKAMMSIEGSDPDYEILGYVSKPELTRANRNGITVVVNGRYIRSMTVNAAIMEAYHTFLPINRFPLAVIEITMHPSLLDVNVHPSKLEVRFSKEAELKSLIQHAIAAVLKTLRYTPGPESITQKMRSAPTLVQDSISFHIADGGLNRTQNISNGDSDSQSFREGAGSSYSNEPNKRYSPSDREREWSSTQMERNRERIPKDAAERLYQPSSFTESETQTETPLQHATNGYQVKEEQESSLELNSSPHSETSGTSNNAPSTFPELHWIGQHHGTYIIAQSEDGLYLIDQHAAHERINYEYYYKKFGSPAPYSQQLIVPITLEFTAAEALALKELISLFEQAGVIIEPFGQQTFIVRAYPEWFPKGQEKEILEEMAELIITEKKKIDIGKLREKAAIMCACKASIKANDSMNREEGESLLIRLAQCVQPYTCPHGRPIIVHLSTYQLEKMFKRVMS